MFVLIFKNYLSTQNIHYVGHMAYVAHTHVELFDLTRVINATKINHLDMTNYDLNVVFNDTTIINNSNDNDFIGPSLGGMGYNRRSHKKTIPKCKFIKG
jgi:hypothetical protein